jgi:hypothetical protein
VIAGSAKAGHHVLATRRTGHDGGAQRVLR